MVWCMVMEGPDEGEGDGMAELMHGIAGDPAGLPSDMVQGGGWGESVTNPFGLGGLWGTGGRWVHHELLVIRNTRYA